MFRNRAKCRNCGDTIESKYGHDFVVCSCFRDEDQPNHGFFLDGGKGADGKGLGTRCGGCFDDIEWLTGETTDEER
jgi:hypothetical protein